MYLSGYFLSPALQITSEPIPFLQTNLNEGSDLGKIKFLKVS